ncbi:MAG: SDR family NAD(P)-dependent oxidoreductase [Arachnia sp.]
MSELKGRRALVTGGGVGIGRAIVEHLCAAGVDVVTTYRSHKPEESFLEEQRALHGGRCEAVAVDARDEKSIQGAVAEAVDVLGGIDILVNNIGGLIERVDTREASLDYWREVMSVNLDSTFLFARESLRHMDSGWGRIVNIASLAGRNGGGGGSTAYATSKAAIFGFTRGLSKEVAGAGITVNAVAPGLILDTPFHDTFTTPENQKAAVESIALKRPGLPDDVAGPVMWLCSDDSSFVTGTIVDINGGQYFA